MSQSDLIYVTDALLASALYFGIMGGVIGSGIFTVAGIVFRAGQRFFKGR